jgi:hypothetical protein
VPWPRPVLAVLEPCSQDMRNKYMFIVQRCVYRATVPPNDGSLVRGVCSLAELGAAIWKLGPTSHFSRSEFNRPHRRAWISRSRSICLGVLQREMPIQ